VIDERLTNEVGVILGEHPFGIRHDRHNTTQCIGQTNHCLMSLGHPDLHPNHKDGLGSRIPQAFDGLDG